MNLTAVPKATINENGNAFRSEDKVWLSEQGVVPTPTSYSAPLEDIDKPEFSAQIAAAAYRSHDRGSL